LRVDSTLAPPAIGATIMLHPAPAHLHWFDPQTQARIA